MSKNVDIDIGNFDINEEDIDIETGVFLGDNDKLKFENKKNFELLLIKPNKIYDRDWSSSTYIEDILNDDFIDFVDSSPETAIDLGTNLEVDKYDLPDVKVSLFYEEPNYHYEIMYLQVLDKYKTEDRENQFSLMLQNNGDEKIYGNVLIMKTYVPIQKMDSLIISNISKNDILRMMNERINTKVILFDNGDYEEKKIIGSMDNFAESFFDEEDKYKIQKMEIAFLKHNINIWFTKFEYGFENVCGNLLKHLVINKCIVFTLIDDNCRGNITMDEFKKIKFLSTKIESYGVPEEMSKDEDDEYGRQIIKNKYRILEYMFNKYK